MYIRGISESGTEGAVMQLDVQIGRNLHNLRYLMPEYAGDVLEIPLKNEGRTFGFCFSNEEGSRWRILGGIQVLFEHRLRAM